MGDFIDLGTKNGDNLRPASPSKVSFPTLYISNIDIYGASVGDDVTIKGKFKSVTENDDGSYSCTISATGLACDSCDSGSGGLESEMDKIAAKKSQQQDEED